MKIVSWKEGMGFTNPCPNCGYRVAIGSSNGSAYLVFEDGDSNNSRIWFSCCDFLESVIYTNSQRYYSNPEVLLIPGSLLPPVEGGW